MNREWNPPQPPGRWPLLYATMGPPLAWAAFHLLAWSLSPVACHAGLSALLYAVGAVAAITAAGAGFVAWRTRGAGNESEDIKPAYAQTSEWLSIFGMSMSVLFTTAILVTAIAFVFLDACEGTP